MQRIIRYAFKLAQSRPRKLLTVVTKSNAQRHAMVMWDEIAAEVAQEFPDVTWDKMLVDAMTMRMVMKPQTLDTIVATNLHADILSDLAAALAGSLGIAPTANINPEREAPSMFEPIHGSAFDITGKGVANPVATFWTAAMMLEHLGEKPAADRLMKAVERVTADPSLHTPDLGGKATTKQVTEAVCEALRQGQRLRAVPARPASGPAGIRSAAAPCPLRHRKRPMLDEPRQLLRAMFDAAVGAASPELRIPAYLPPPPKGRTVVIGAGKASAAMAQAVEDGLARSADRTRRHPLRPRRPLRADRDRRSRASRARRERPPRRQRACWRWCRGWGRTTSCWR